MASKIKMSGIYDYKVLEITNQKCSIEFFKKGESIDISHFTIDDAKKAGTGAGDNGSGKMIDKFTRNMLFARALSNGVRWFCPDIFHCPVYNDEEMQEEMQQENEIDEIVKNLIEEMHKIETVEAFKDFYEKNKQYGDQNSTSFRANFNRASNLIYKKLNKVKTTEETPKQIAPTVLNPIDELKACRDWESLKRVMILYPEGSDKRTPEFQKILRDKQEIYFASSTEIADEAIKAGV